VDINTQVKEQTVIFDEISIRFFFRGLVRLGGFVFDMNTTGKVQTVMTGEDLIFFTF